MGDLFGILIEGFFELVFIIFTGMFEVGAAIFGELISAIVSWASDNLYITIPVLSMIFLTIIVCICRGIYNSVNRKKNVHNTQVFQSDNRNSVVYKTTNYYYDDDDYDYDDDDDEEEEDNFMSNVYRSEVGLFGDEVFYDKNGTKIGHAESGLFGDKVYYDKSGAKVMTGEVGLLGDTTYYDTSYNKIGKSESGILGDKKIFDANGSFIGSAETGLLGDKKYTKK